MSCFKLPRMRVGHLWQFCQSANMAVSGPKPHVGPCRARAVALQDPHSTAPARLTGLNTVAVLDSALLSPCCVLDVACHGVPRTVQRALLRGARGGGIQASLSSLEGPDGPGFLLVVRYSLLQPRYRPLQAATASLQAATGHLQAVPQRTGPWRARSGPCGHAQSGRLHAGCQGTVSGLWKRPETSGVPLGCCRHACCAPPAACRHLQQPLAATMLEQRRHRCR
jgi:hypothetical protein